MKKEQTTIEIAINKAMQTIKFDQDPLSWWRSVQHEIPGIAAVARYILAIPATKAPCEGCFEHEWFVIDQTSKQA